MKEDSVSIYFHEGRRDAAVLTDHKCSGDIEWWSDFLSLA